MNDDKETGMTPLYVRIGDMCLRTTSPDIGGEEPHTSAEIVKYSRDSKDNEYLYVIARWKLESSEGYDLEFIGSRPFCKGINPEVFMEIAKGGQRYLDIFFDSREEEI